ncbi:putative nuclease HARBI1 [Eupeodes corollae]|uniref:putative nuclease HARBI1 n=1 Tax=Eupeodes corollae TaxID=290404 RepID=UPI0024901727|nr:putative nuclease HARBI1 [Eupeodes corollae]
MSKNSAYIVLEQIRSQIENATKWNHSISAETKLLLTLRLYASGSLLITAGDFCGVSKSSATRICKIVSHHIARLQEKYIKFPATPEEKFEVVNGFYQFARLSRLIAALDCTHVRIHSPGGANGEIFQNRKGYFSFNVQTMCDSKLKIMDIVARWPGSSHDSTIFNNSRICARFENGDFGNHLIVADSGYQCRRYMMTPLRNCNNPQETLYNESQIRTRNCVERSYGVWKRRFPILSTGIKVKLTTIQSIIVATAVLHNICCKNNEADPPAADNSINEAMNNGYDSERTSNSQNENTSVRSSLVNDYFRSLLG